VVVTGNHYVFEIAAGLDVTAIGRALVRQSRGGMAVTVSAAAAAAVVLALVVGVIPTPDLAAALSDATDALGAWTYLAVPGLAFLETAAFVGLAVPGETAVVVGGVAAQLGQVALLPLIALVWLGAVAGDLASFALGRRLGPQFLHTHGRRLGIRAEHLARTEDFFARHGGKAVLVGRFVGVLRALTPFLAGTSLLPLRRLLPYSVVGGLAWATTFTLVGYGFAMSFESAGETATRIALGAGVLIGMALLLAPRLRRTRPRASQEPHTDQGDERAEAGPHEGAGDDVEGVVHAQVDARQADRGGQAERPPAQPGRDQSDGGRSREGGGAVPGRERRITGNGDERAKLRIGDGRPWPVEGVLEPVDHDRAGQHGERGGGARYGQAPSADVRAEPEDEEQRTLDPPNVPELLVLVNAHASGVADPNQTGRDVVAVLEELGASATSAVTSTKRELWDCLRAAARRGYRVALVGGDGSLHAAANAPLLKLPELAIIPAGRANNIARALGIPSARSAALRTAAFAPARPLDALVVRTPERSLYALEALSAGFQADARASYHGENSADLRRGVRALIGALRRYKPYGIRTRVDGSELGSSAAAQLFLSNLRYFGFGFDVAPHADPADGRFEAILLEAPNRRTLLKLLVATYRGRQLTRPGVQRQCGRHAELTEPLPLVADATLLGTTTATVSVEPGRLPLAVPVHKRQPGGPA
jgi:membrane protein DedA with SNARE-associated domain/diacylglycerol kinase family enzyme